MSSLAEARAAKKRLVAQLAEHGDHAGVGLTGRPGDYGLRVDAPDAAVAERVPEAMDGVEVHVAVVGHIHAQT
ncbi:hypothetical protein [Georgenia wangjunii]|uniref:hypothetical protein n=1 Tax=Georgenia wangjunii TaxID=3117730 RepID=UPI002F26AFE3